MRDDLIELKLAKLEKEIRDLRLEFESKKKKKPSRKRPGSFAELRGFLKGKTSFTDEEIEAAKIRVKELPE